MLHTKVDKIFCINLDRRPDRWESVQKQFQKHGIKNVERFSAVDGNSIKVNNQINLLPGEIGCLLSHLEIVKKAKEQGLKNYLVLEDDVIFRDDFSKLYERFNKQIPEDWNMVYLGGNNVIDHPVKISENVFKIYNTYAIHAVIVKDTLYDYLIEMLPKMKKPVDVYFADLQKIFNCYCFNNPKLAWQNTGFSDIQMKEINYNFLKT
jgi:glycosyl transferase family 25